MLFVSEVNVREVNGGSRLGRCFNLSNNNCITVIIRPCFKWHEQFISMKSGYPKKRHDSFDSQALVA